MSMRNKRRNLQKAMRCLFDLEGVERDDQAINPNVMESSWSNSSARGIDFEMPDGSDSEVDETYHHQSYDFDSFFSEIPEDGGDNFHEFYEEQFDNAETQNFMEPELKPSLAEDLLLFFLMFNIPKRAMLHLLDILNHHHVEGVPRSLYFLKKCLKSTNYETLDMSSGKFAYLGLINNVKHILENKLMNPIPSILDLKINIDGLPLFRSSRINLWPILVQVTGFLQPLPVAVFCGFGKPELLPFITRLKEELLEIRKDGINFEEHVINLGKVLFIADTPARCFIQCISGHNSYHGCGWCRQIGTYNRDHHRMTFCLIKDEKRSDNLYKLFQESNQLSLSPLADIVPLYSNFPPDYMHIVCLGVVRKLLHFYSTSQKGMRMLCKLSPRQIDVLNNRITSFVQYIPREFQRKPRTFSDLEFFKASEFRSFLLYVGPYCFKSVLAEPYYEHFLLLHFAMYVFVSNSHTSLYEHANTCIERFVAQSPQLYHASVISYNFHALLHLFEFVKLYGSLDSFSTFPFENYLYLVKRRVRCNNGIFAQSVNHLINIRSIYIHFNEPNVFFSTETPDNCAVLEDGKVVLITSVLGDSVSGRLLNASRDLYSYPYPSRVLGIAYYSISRAKLTNVKPKRKAIIFPVDNEYLVFPFA